MCAHGLGADRRITVYNPYSFYIHSEYLIGDYLSNGALITVGGDGEPPSVTNKPTPIETAAMSHQ